MIIHVLQEDIDKGIKSDGAHCPVANAISRQLDIVPKNNFMVLPYIVTLEDSSEWYISESTSQKIIVFDDSGFMKPFNFRLKPIGKALPKW